MDAILIAMLAAFSVGGCFKGFVRSVFSLLSFFVAILLSFWLSPSVSGLLSDRQVLAEPIYSSVSSCIIGLDEDLASQSFSSPTEMAEAVRAANLPLHAELILNKIIEKTSFDGEMTVAEVISPALYSILVKLISFLGLWIIFYLIFKLAQIYVTKLINLPFLKVTDKLLGFMFGFVEGLLLYGVLVCALILLSEFTLSSWLITKIDSGYVSSMIYDNFGEKLLRMIYFK